MCLQHFYACSLILNHLIHNGRKQIFSFPRFSIKAFQKFCKPRFQFINERCRSRPHIHRHSFTVMNPFCNLRVVADDHPVLFFNTVSFHNTGKLFSLGYADTSCHCSIGAQRMIKKEPCHCHRQFFLRLFFIYKEIMQLHKRFFSIIIIRIDHNERFFHHIFTAQYRLAGSPRLLPLFCKLLILTWNIGNLLIYIDNFHLFGNAVTDHRLEFFFNIPTDNEDNFVKTGFFRIIDRIIHNDLSIGSHLCKLFEPRSVSGADPGRQNHQCGFHLFFLLLLQSQCICDCSHLFQCNINKIIQA